MGRVIGLDIGSSAVRGVEVRGVGSKAVLGKAFEVPLAPGAVISGDIRDEASVVAALSELRTRAKFGTKNVVIGIANGDFVTRLIDRPAQPHAEMKKALKYDIPDYFDVGSDDPYYDAHVIREWDDPTRPGQRMTTMLVTGASREMVHRFTDAVDKSGFTPVKVDASPLAIIRSTWDGQNNGPEAIVDIGASKTIVVVQQGGQPMYIRILPNVGGESVTSHLQRTFSWTYEEAESSKIALGLVSGLEVSSMSNVFNQQQDAGNDDTRMIARAIAEVMEGIIGNIRESIEVVSHRYPIQRLLLSGGGSQMTGLPARLGSELGLPVVMAHINAAGADKPQFTSHPGRMTIAAGLGAA